jgi:hypothetical protein
VNNGMERRQIGTRASHRSTGRARRGTSNLSSLISPCRRARSTARMNSSSISGRESNGNSEALWQG